MLMIMFFVYCTPHLKTVCYVAAADAVFFFSFTECLHQRVRLYISGYTVCHFRECTARRRCWQVRESNLKCARCKPEYSQKQTHHLNLFPIALNYPSLLSGTSCSHKSCRPRMAASLQPYAPKNCPAALARAPPSSGTRAYPFRLSVAHLYHV